MTILTTPAILQWDGEVKHKTAVHDEYVGLLCDAYGYFTYLALRDDPGTGSALRSNLTTLTGSQLARLLTAPETSYRLFFRRENVITTARFLRQAYHAEMLMSERQQEHDESVWSALGDYSYEPLGEGPLSGSAGGRVYHAPCLGGQLPIDAISPHALKVSVKGESVGRSDQNEPVSAFEPEEQARAMRHVAVALNLMAKIAPAVAAFVLSFTKVIVVRKDASDVHSFSSASSGQYVGRTLLVNPHEDDFAGPVLADGLIHEAIHSLLYMQERKRPWVFNDDLYFADWARVDSPWSGRSLRLRPYLQACFVWYGLYNFWRSPGALSVFGESTVNEFLSRAREGFLRERLIERVQQWAPKIDKNLLEAIDTVQHSVRLTAS